MTLTASRGKWIDQSQSHNVFIQGTSGKLLHDLYTYAWNCGIKTTYYLRSLGASQVEKATLDAEKYGFTQMRSYDATTESKTTGTTVTPTVVTDIVAESIPMQSCRIDNPECESCQ